MKLTRTNRIIIAVAGLSVLFLAVLFPPWMALSPPPPSLPVFEEYQGTVLPPLDKTSPGKEGAEEYTVWKGHKFLMVVWKTDYKYYFHYALDVVLLELGAIAAVTGAAVFVVHGFHEKSRPGKDE
jgi:hypothetical protein